MKEKSQLELNFFWELRKSEFRNALLGNVADSEVWQSQQVRHTDIPTHTCVVVLWRVRMF
jgi:hypothetical protein